jgi:hypothetical protein
MPNDQPQVVKTMQTPVPTGNPHCCAIESVRLDAFTVRLITQSGASGEHSAEDAQSWQVVPAKAPSLHPVPPSASEKQ